MSQNIPNGAAGPSRPPFAPTQHSFSSPSPLPSLGEDWIEPLSSPCHFTLNTFLSITKELTLHPERNSTLILRADPLPPRTVTRDDELARRLQGLSLDGMELVEEIRVRLMPRMVKRDGRLDETVQFYRSRGRKRRRPSLTKEQAHEAQLGPEEEAEEDEGEEALVVMTPEVKDVADIPYFHPPVKQLAYRWTSSAPSLTDEADDDSDVPPVRGRISVAYLPYPPDTTSVATQAQAPAPSPFIPIPRRAAPRKRSPLAPAGSQAAEILDEDGTAVPEHRPRTPVGPERLQRTMLALLERIYKHGFGSMVGYVKRKHHDVVVQREKFQDLYLELKERHRHLDSRAPKPGSAKVEDVKRHVFKEDMGLPHSSLSPFHSISTIDLSSWGEQDVAIAAFLMLLWKDMYPAREPSPVEDVEEREWDCWGRPPGGFIDLGCGNGLLVHVLTSEGYYGRGYELRARRTWPLYPPGTREALVELPIDLPGWFPSTVAEWESGSWPGRDSCAIKEGAFLIGNHADELTPWLPLLSLIPRHPIPYLSLPCCLHTWDDAFTHLVFNPPAHDHSPVGGFDAGLESGNSRYKAYLMWLGWVGLMCGWEWEKEGLRVPSTKGWGIVARKRWTTSAEEDHQCRIWALEQVNEVRTRGQFKVREKEGKEH